MKAAFGGIFCILVLLPELLHTQISSDVTITMSDGVKLDATLSSPFFPSALSPGVILVHGYGGNKDDMETLWYILSLNGYRSLAYSVRGQGNSEGVSTTMGERERQDLQEVVEYYRTVAGIDADRIAVAGGSQGGIHSWMAAVYAMPGVKVIAPLIATPHFALDLIPENCIKQGLYREMSLGTVRYSAERDRVRDFIVHDLYDSVRAYVDQRDLERYIDSVRIPVIQGLAWTDILFPVNAGIRAAENLARRGIPVWSYYGTNGHSYDGVINTSEATFWIYENLTWLNHWLKDDTLSGDMLPRTFYSDDRPDWPHHVTDVWPPQPEGNLRLYITNGMLSPSLLEIESSSSFSLRYDSTFSPDSGWTIGYGGQRFLTAFQSTPARFISGPVVETMEVTGIPAGRLYVTSNSAQFQAHVRLYDVVQSDTGDVWQLMTRSTYGVRGYTPQAVSEIEYECSALSHSVPAGHKIGVEISSLDMGTPDIAYTIPYFRSTSSSVISSQLQPSYITLPLVGTGSVNAITQNTQPSVFELLQNYPNPFNSSTVISFTLRERSDIALDIYDLLGRRIAAVFNGSLDAGSHTIRFNGKDMPSGVYFYRLSRGKVVDTRKMVLVK
jgi:predicted acyl esterase